MMKDNKDLKIIDKKFNEPFIPKTETRIILEQKDLYPDLEYGDIGVQKGYGPCTGSNCTHTFWLKLTIGYEGFWGANGYYFTEGSNNNITAYTMESIHQARNLLRKFHNGTVWVCNQVGAASNNTRRKNRQAIEALESWIGVFEGGQSVDKTVDLGR